MTGNPNQARDDRGRWASGGSGERMTKAAREKVAIGKAVDERHFGVVAAHDGTMSVHTAGAMRDAWAAKTAGMSARQHGAAARAHRQEAKRAGLPADRAAHQIIAGWHGIARESMTGRKR